MNYTKAFNEALNYSKTNNLFLGYGNPNGKVLIVGKEMAFNHEAKPGNSEFITEIVDESKKQNELNVVGWEKNIKEQTVPSWEDMPTGLVNPLYSWGSQLNIANRGKETPEGIVWNGGTSHTYLKYQKFHQFLSNSEKKSEKIDFQKDFFLTELNDIPTKYSYRDAELDMLRAESVRKRNFLLKMDFFRSFPIIIIAAGHYPREYEFDMEATFDVAYVGHTNTVGDYWYNIHRNEDGKRILIHTRQLSTDVPDQLLKAIADECRPMFESI